MITHGMEASQGAPKYKGRLNALFLQPSDSISTFNLERELDRFKLRCLYALFSTRRPKISVENVDKLKAFVVSASVSLVTQKKKRVFPTKTNLQLLSSLPLLSPP